MRRIIASVFTLAVAIAAGATLSVLGDAREGGTIKTVPAGFVPTPVLDSLSIVPMEGWPQYMTVHSTYIPVGLAIADINHDGTLEAIAGSSDSLLYVWDYQGKPLPGWPKQLPGMVQSKVAVGDLNRDGTEDIVVASEDGTISALDYLGNNVTGWPQTVERPALAVSPTLYDVDSDDTLEVVMSCAGKIYVWNHDGALVSGWPVQMDGAAVGPVSAGDVDGDGTVELCALCYGAVYLFDAHGHPESGWPVVVGDGAGYSQALLYDLDRDGRLEVGFASCPHIDGQVFIYRSDGSSFPGWPQTMYPPQPYVCPVAGGLLNDSVYSIFSGGHLLGGPGFHAWTQDGVHMSAWPVWPDILECSPVVFDLQGDWHRCVMIASNTTPGYMCAYDRYGTLVDGFPIETTGPTMPNSPVVGDIDADGILEIGLLTINGTVSMWKVRGVEYHPYLTDWGTWYHDNWNTGQLHPEPPTGLDATIDETGVHLVWDDVRDWCNPCYNVYRSTVPDSGFSKLASPAAAAYDDTTALPDTVYYYAVTLSEESGVESRLSTRIVPHPVGIQEKRLDRNGTMGAQATIARGVLLLPASVPTADRSLLAIDGRKVLDLHSGVNDVRALAPGVYFIREATGGAGPKVVLTK